MLNVRKLAIVTLLIMFPLWGILLPLKLIESTIVYADPPTPSFTELLQVFFTTTDFLFISIGWLFLFLAAILILKGDAQFITSIHVAAVIFLGYSFFLFINDRNIAALMEWKLGIYVLLTQGLVCAIPRMVNFDSRKHAQ